MKKKSQKLRTHYFIPVEGEGEQSLIKWIQGLCDDHGLHVHLDSPSLGGGGYEPMLKKTKRYRAQKERLKAKATILLVDSDRADQGDDGWSIDKLKQEAKKYQIDVCIQIPNLEGWLLRMIPGNEYLQLDNERLKEQLKKDWPNYKKPVDKRTLASKFSHSDLLRAAEYDSELNKLLEIIRLKK